MTVTDVIFGLILALMAGTATAFAIVARPAVRDARAVLRNRRRA